MPSWDTYVHWLLAVAMVIVAIYSINTWLHQPRVEIVQNSLGGMCVSEYNYHVNKFCLYFKGQDGLTKKYSYIYVDDSLNLSNGTIPSTPMLS
jgi:hypothetical protein